MAQVAANGITIEYEESGPPSGPALLMINGLGVQLSHWPEPFVTALAEAGLRAIIFDNRDIGLSTKFEAAGVPSLKAMLMRTAMGLRPDAPYGLDDMAADAVGLLDALGIERAHVLGLSMGGMIAQIVAARWPARTRSLISIMSTSGRPDLPQARPEAREALTSQPASEAREDLIAHGVAIWRAIGSPGFPVDEAFLRDHVARNVDRSYYPDGFVRQFAAILASKGRVELLKTVAVPTLVIHGRDDPLIPVECGEDTAALVPGAELMVIDGMGHDLPPALWPRLVAAIAEHCRRADGDEGRAVSGNRARGSGSGPGSA